MTLVGPKIATFLHEPSDTFSYVVADPDTGCAAVIDPALDYDPWEGRITAHAVGEIFLYLTNNNLKVQWLLETHLHNDHLTAADFLKRQFPTAKTAIGKGVRNIQKQCKSTYNLDDSFVADGSQFDHLFAGDEEFNIGNLTVQVLDTCGHTEDGITYVIGDAAFIGDTLFMPDYGTARCDFPGGDAAELYRSIQRLFELPDNTRLFMCHDYIVDGRKHMYETTVGEEKSSNKHLHDGVSEEDFVEMRVARDATLDVPRLMIPSIQVNIRAGRLPPPEGNGVTYLKVPVTTL